VRIVCVSLCGAPARTRRRSRDALGTSVAEDRHMKIPGFSLHLIGTSMLLGLSVFPAQQPPPISGFNGTVALEGTVDEEYAGAHAILVKTTSGLRHLVHLTRGTTVHGAKKADPLKGLEAGTPVVVHYVGQGERVTAVEVDRIASDGLQTIEGVVTRVDRHAKTLGLRLEDGATDVLHLTDRAAADVGKQVGETDRVIVYYTDDEGHRIVHFFKHLAR
jgi:hypothetical protein